MQKVYKNLKTYIKKKTMEKENYIQAKQFLHNTLGFTKEELALQIKVNK
jgi:hypothetical protein